MHRSSQELRAIRKELLQLRARQHRLALHRAGNELLHPLSLVDGWFTPGEAPGGSSIGWLQVLLAQFRSPLLKGLLGILLAYLRLRKKGKGA